jgi:hypothetical protein
MKVNVDPLYYDLLNVLFNKESLYFQDLQFLSHVTDVLEPVAQHQVTAGDF